MIKTLRFMLLIFIIAVFSIQVTSTSLDLHYWSPRVGLNSWVMGMVEATAKLLFNLPQVGISLLRGRADGTCDHEVFHVTFPRQSRCLSKEAEISCQADSSTYIPEPALFHRIFPFHIVLDKDLQVLQLGTGLRCTMQDSQINVVI